MRNPLLSLKTSYKLFLTLCSMKISKSGYLVVPFSNSTLISSFRTPFSQSHLTNRRSSYWFCTISCSKTNSFSKLIYIKYSSFISNQSHQHDLAFLIKLIIEPVDIISLLLITFQFHIDLFPFMVPILHPIIMITHFTIIDFPSILILHFTILNLNTIKPTLQLPFFHPSLYTLHTLSHPHIVLWLCSNLLFHFILILVIPFSPFLLTSLSRLSLWLYIPLQYVFLQIHFLSYIHFHLFIKKLLIVIF